MKRILIVENEKDHRRLLRDTLRILNYDIVEAGDTTVAEQILAQEAIDLIILDHGLPDTHGADWYFQFLQRQPNRIRSIPVLFVTQFGMNEELKEPAREKKVLLIPKPLEAQDLIDAVKKLLKM